MLVLCRVLLVSVNILVRKQKQGEERISIRQSLTERVTIITPLQCKKIQPLFRMEDCTVKSQEHFYVI